MFKQQLVCTSDKSKKKTFLLFSFCLYKYIYIYIDISWYGNTFFLLAFFLTSEIVLYFSPNTHVPYFYIDVALTC